MQTIFVSDLLHIFSFLFGEIKGHSGEPNASCNCNPWLIFPFVIECQKKCPLKQNRKEIHTTGSLQRWQTYHRAHARGCVRNQGRKKHKIVLPAKQLQAQEMLLGVASDHATPKSNSIVLPKYTRTAFSFYFPGSAITQTLQNSQKNTNVL